MNLISKEIRRAEHEYMNIHPPPPPPPINALVTPLNITLQISQFFYIFVLRAEVCTTFEPIVRLYAN